MKGTIVNVIAVIVGSSLGIFIGDKLPKRFKAVIIQAIGLFTFLIGTSMMLKGEHFIIVFLALILGGITGESLRLEAHLTSVIERLKSRVSPGSPHFVEGFVTATLIFCVGAMTVVGSIQEGLTGDATLLYTKSVMDGITSLTLASSFGIGVIFSAGSVLVIQGSLTLLGSKLQFLTNPAYINNLTSVGGVLIIALGFELLKIRKIKILNLLPALVYAVLFTLLVK